MSSFSINKNLYRNSRGDDAYGCGGRTRTCDLVVMSHASCRCSTPRYLFYSNNYNKQRCVCQSLALRRLAMQKEVHPGLEIALIGWLVADCSRLGLLIERRDSNGVRHRYVRRHHEHFLTRRSQTKFLARRNFEVLVGVEILVLQLEVVIFVSITLMPLQLISRTTIKKTASPATRTSRKSPAYSYAFF